MQIQPNHEVLRCTGQEDKRTRKPRPHVAFHDVGFIRADVCRGDRL